jgi:membrane dipeptidase
MKNKILLIVGSLLVAAVVAFFALLPGLVDRGSNTVDRSVPLPAVTANHLHQGLTIVDLHADPLLWRRNLQDELDHGHVDLPRLIRGNVAIQVFGVATKSPVGLNYDANSGDTDQLTALVVANMQPPRTWGSLYQRALFQAQKLHELAAAAPDQLQLVGSRAELESLLRARASGTAVVGGMLGLEGAHALEGDIDKLDGLFAAGFRLLGLAHFFDNAVAGSMHGMEKYGLTPLGREVVRRAEQLGMIVDIAHSSPATIDEVLAMATRPVVVSHGGVKATCDTNRNLSDGQIQAIARNGGVIGVGYWNAAVCDITPAGIVAAMSHIRELVGVEHIALGSDFDGGTQTAFDTSELAVITQALLIRGFSEADIGLVMGGNAVRLLRQLLPPAAVANSHD